MNVIAKHLFAVSLTLRHLSLTFLLGLSEPIARWSPRVQQLSATAHEIGSLSQVRSGSSTCATPRTRDCPERSLLCSAVRPATHQPVSDVVRCAFRCLSSSVFMSISVVLFCAFLCKATKERTHLIAPEMPFVWITTEQIKFTDALHDRKLHKTQWIVTKRRIRSTLASAKHFRTSLKTQTWFRCSSTSLLSRGLAERSSQLSGREHGTSVAQKTCKRSRTASHFSQNCQALSPDPLVRQFKEMRTWAVRGECE